VVFAKVPVIITSAPATNRSFSFIGVTTAQSAIMDVFPRWAEHLGLSDVNIVGIDFAPRSERQSYRDAVTLIKMDDLELGGLVTTHKLDLFGACRDLFDYVDPYAELLSEVSSISKRGGQFRAHAKDPISSGRALSQFIGPGYWSATGAMALLFGAGGANSAISVNLVSGRPQADRPACTTLVDIDPGRLAAARQVHERLGETAEVRYVLSSGRPQNESLMASLPDGSLVVNGTGMGKDSPGSPVSDQAIFPEHGLVWEINYRGSLDFLYQAQRQRKPRQLHVEDGWNYFVHGWCCVIEEVFNIEIGAPMRQELSDIAVTVRHRREKAMSDSGFDPETGTTRPTSPK
jgi:shikimate 5-dehydrogenase